MAYLRLGNIKANMGIGGIAKGLSNCIRYIMNPSKTQNQKHIGGYNIIVPDYKKEEAVFDSMISTKKQFGKEEGRQGYHFKLSFASNDNISAEKAIDLTYQFCEKCFKDYECIFAVHDNTAHLHSHIVINSIDMVEGKKYHYKKGDWANIIQPEVNEICKINNLSEIDLSMDEDFILKHKCRNYRVWNHAGNKSSDSIFYSNKMIKADVDECITVANDFAEFKLLMQKKGHRFEDTGKHIKVLAPGRERFCRLYSLTPDKKTYTRTNIIKMIEGTYMTRKEVQERLMSEWNRYKPRGICVVKIRFSVEFLKLYEENQMLLSKQIVTIQDAQAYLEYLKMADKELNIIRKKVSESMKERQMVLDKVTELMSLVKYYGRYNSGDIQFKKEYERVNELYNDISSAGYHLADLYRYNSTGEQLIRNIDEYKTHIYVQTKVCNRIIQGKDEKQVPEVRQVR